MVNREAYLSLKEALKCGNIEDYEYEAKIIFRDILHKDYRGDTEFSEKRELEQIVKKRISGYPLQYILGEWDFYNITLKVGDGVLIPRQDTETLVEAGLSLIKGRKIPNVLDLCSGSGAVVLALSENGKGNFYAIEKEEKAYSYLCENNKMYGSKVKTIRGDCLNPKIIESLPDFELIISNPPYLTEAETENLQREVSFEPITALLGGKDGLMFYREISRLYKNKLVNGGNIAFEIGVSQGESVENILKENGYTDVRIIKDLCNKDRVAVGTRVDFAHYL